MVTPVDWTQWVAWQRWVRARRELISWRAPGRWHVMKIDGAPIVAVNTRSEYGGGKEVIRIVDEMDDADLSPKQGRRNAEVIVAAVNDQEAMVRLVEAAGRLSALPLAGPEVDELRAALYAVVTGEGA